MTIWLVRGGGRGEHEEKFLAEQRIYFTWGGLNRDMGRAKTKAELRRQLEEVYPASSKARISSTLAQAWAFAHLMSKGDWVLMPRKGRGVIAVGELQGDYEFVASGPDPFFHARKIKWTESAISRSSFDQDILYSLGAFKTIAKIERNDAERRVRAMAKAGWKAGSVPYIGAVAPSEDDLDGDGVGEQADLEQVARDQIAKTIIAKFKGHGMALLVEAILKSQGYTTIRSPEGPDKGIDILAAPAPMGFGQPRLCVQVKSAEGPIDRQILDQLIGAMQNVQAQHGLLVSWGGFKSTVMREEATQFFRVRLWDQQDIIEQLFASYDRLDEDLRTQIPLKRIWTLASQDEGDSG